MAEELDRAVVQIALLRLLSDASPAGHWAINLSAQAAISPQFVEWLCALLAAQPDLARRLVFEVDELAVASHTPAIVQLAGRLRERGSDLAIDRFAARHGAFGYLESVMPAYLKLDGSVVHDLHQRADNRFFVRSLAAVAKVLEVPVIAQWVECEAEWNSLRSLGVFAAQGYYVERPEAL
jgi:EAL domain-containing protein (putative c-di-GMP-specific phosphodiesterase class I)